MHHDRVGNFQNARFFPLQVVAGLGLQQEDHRVGDGANRGVALAGTDGFDQDTVEAEGCATRNDRVEVVGDGLAAGLGGQAADEDAGVVGAGGHAETVAEQSAAMAAMAPSDTAGARMAARMSFGSMVEIEPDKTGRITIPANLREYAGLGKDVVIVGVDTRFEIWDAANWEAYVAEQEAAYADMESEGMPTLS